MKTYETLVLELNKLCAEEQNISKKLFPDNLKVCLHLFFIFHYNIILSYCKLIHICIIFFCVHFKEIPMACQNNEPSESKGKKQTKEITRKKHNTSNERTKLNENKKQITGK